jgi:hypothetical protein
MRAPGMWVSRALALAACAVAFALPAAAGQNCEAKRPSVESMTKDLALAASVAEQLDAMATRDGTRVVVIARAGQDLSEYGLRWSHLGIAYRDAAALDGRGAWRIVHKLNQCGSDRSTLYRQGLAEFFGDGLFVHEAGIVPLTPEVQARLLRELGNDGMLTRLHEPRYNMLAYPWSGPYQQSNQWALETLAMLVEPGIASREAARNWLRDSGYRPQTVRVSAMKRLGARIGTAHIAFDDHPFDRRMAGQIDTVTVESVFAWLQRARLGEAPRVLRTQPSGAPFGPRRPGVPVGAGLERAEVDLLRAADAPVLVQEDAGPPDLAERLVVAVLEGKR